jgi:hypothetical protein
MLAYTDTIRPGFYPSYFHLPSDVLRNVLGSDVSVESVEL